MTNAEKRARTIWLRNTAQTKTENQCAKAACYADRKPDSIFCPEHSGDPNWHKWRLDNIPLATLD